MEFLKRSLPSIPSSHTMPPPSPPRS
jgi:hypothetical protein